MTMETVNRVQSASASLPEARSALRVVRRWISLAAAPVFAIMAIVCVVWPGPMALMCAGDAGAFSLTGMAWMYALMSVFHAGVWLQVLDQKLRS